MSTVSLELQGAPTTASISSSRYYPALDGLRAVAILMVLADHFGGGAKSSSSALRAFAAARSLGWAGVDLFFVLSGFLITGILVDTRSARNNYFRNFYARRALRIIPPLWAVWLATFAVGGFVPHYGDLFVFLYIGNPMNVIHPAWGPIPALRHTWSLAVEEQFYLIWPLVVYRIDRLDRLLWVTGAIVLAALLLRTTLSVGDADPVWTYELIFCRMDELALGAAVAVVLRGVHRDRLLRAAPAACIGGFVAVTLMCLARGTTTPYDSIGCTVAYVPVGCTCAAMLCWALRSGSVAERICSTRWLRFLGRCSYGLYLVHPPVQQVLWRAQPILQPTFGYYGSGALLGLLGIPLCIAIAAISYRWFETPILKLKDRFA